MCGAMATFGVWLCQSGQMRWDFTCSLREKMLPENFFMKQSSCNQLYITFKKKNLKKKIIYITAAGPRLADKEIEEERVRSERIDR